MVYSWWCNPVNTTSVEDLTSPDTLDGGELGSVENKATKLKSQSNSTKTHYLHLL